VINVLTKSSKTYNFSAVLTPLLLTVASMQLCLLQKSSSFLLRLGQIRQNAEANNKNPTHRSLPYICALIKQAILTNP